MATIQQVLQAAASQLDTDDAQREAEILLCHVLCCNTAHLAAWPDKALDATQHQQFLELLLQRKQGKPVAYIKGEKEFWSRDFSVNQHTLIPRPDTELLIEFVLDSFDATQPLKLADLGTGSGAIAITLACERPHWHIIASDIDAQTLAVAEQNASRHHANNIEFRHGNWFDVLTDKQNIIVSNPPYIAADDSHLQQGDLRFEPRAALASGSDGLDDIRQLCQQAPQQLLPDGCLIVEHGYDQKLVVQQLFTANGFGDIQQRHDYADQPRLTAGKLIN